MLGGECCDSAIVIIGIMPGSAIGGDSCGTVVLIVGVRGFPLFVPNGLHQFGQVVNAVVGVANGVGAGAASVKSRGQINHPLDRTECVS